MMIEASVAELLGNVERDGYRSGVVICTGVVDSAGVVVGPEQDVPLAAAGNGAQQVRTTDGRDVLVEAVLTDGIEPEALHAAPQVGAGSEPAVRARVARQACRGAEIVDDFVHCRFLERSNA